MGACPEYSTDVQVAKDLSPAERVRMYMAEASKKARSATANPGCVLPECSH
jgi:hypothetical protein